MTAFRPLLFLDLSSLGDPLKTSDVPTLILVHHVLSRANLPNALPLPYELHGWTEAEYVRWLNEHREDERMGMVEGVLRRWDEREKKRAEEGTEKSDEDTAAEQVVVLVRSIIARAHR